MKKIIAILAVAIIGMQTASNANAIEPQWSKGTTLGGIMAGIDPWYLLEYDVFYFGGIGFVDYVLVDSWWKGHFTVGGQVGYIGGAVSGLHWSSFAAAPRVTYGLNITDKFEVHAGVNTGLAFGKGWTHFIHNEFVGMHLFFSENIAFTAQAGYSLGLDDSYSPSLTAGISFVF